MPVDSRDDSDAPSDDTPSENVSAELDALRAMIGERYAGNDTDDANDARRRPPDAEPSTGDPA